MIRVGGSLGKRERVFHHIPITLLRQHRRTCIHTYTCTHTHVPSLCALQSNLNMSRENALEKEKEETTKKIRRRGKKDEKGREDWGIECY